MQDFKAGQLLKSNPEESDHRSADRGAVGAFATAMVYRSSGQVWDRRRRAVVAH